MIKGTILNNPPVRTSFGFEYAVMFDISPEAGVESGCSSTAISRNGRLYQVGDRVQIAYQSTRSYGLWFIAGKVN